MSTGKLEEQKMREHLETYEDVTKDTLGGTGVLLSDQIKLYVSNYKMIDPFEEKNLKAAAYQLSVGDEYAINGEIKSLTESPGDKITIPPFELAVIKTREIINLPRFLIARWNIRVSHAYKGLLWVGAAQVDPGWVGHLSCPIYNLSNKSVTLLYGERLATMDFVKTTEFNSISIKYPRPPEKVLFKHYHPDELKSALFSKVNERMDRAETSVDKAQVRIDKAEDKFSKLEGNVYTALAMVIAVLAILFAILSTFLNAGQNGIDIDSALAKAAFLFAAISLLLSLIALSRSPTSRGSKDRSD